ncbi:MAG: ERF family protein [Shewanella sp.]|nr:ERF family protein [Shewanella sp.]
MENALTIVETKNEMLSMMERLATTPNMNVDVLKQMMDLQERVLDRNAKQDYMASFAEMQPKLPAIEKKGTAHNSKYAKYEDIIDSVRPILGNHGFGFSHKVNQTDAKIEVTCTLTHKSGYSESTQFVAPADTGGSKNAVQAVGSTIAYGKRYTLLALLGIATKDEDDDGDTANPITIQQALEIDNLIDETGVNKANFLLTYFGIEGDESDVHDIQSRDYERAVNLLKLKKKGAKNG